MKTRKFLFQVSEELFQAMEHARGEASRNPYLEACLWGVESIRKAAKAAGIKKPDRPSDGRGRKKKKAKGV